MMNKLFNMDNPFWQSMSTLFDLFVLNCLWLICCIPIVTIGPSTTALFYALIQRAQGLDSYPRADFFRSFRQNLKQGMLLGVILTAIGAFLALDMYMCYHAGRGIYSFFLFFFAAIFLFWAFTTLYAFPILAKFERKTSEIVIWAFTLSIKNLPMTLMMLFVIVAGLWFCHILPALIFIVFGLVAQFCAPVLASIFKPFIPVEEDEEDEFEKYAEYSDYKKYEAEQNGTDIDSENNTKSKDYMDYDNIQDLF